MANTNPESKPDKEQVKEIEQALDERIRDLMVTNKDYIKGSTKVQNVGNIDFETVLAIFAVYRSSQRLEKLSGRLNWLTIGLFLTSIALIVLTGFLVYRAFYP